MRHHRLAAMCFSNTWRQCQPLSMGLRLPPQLRRLTLRLRRNHCKLANARHRPPPICLQLPLKARRLICSHQPSSTGLGTRSHCSAICRRIRWKVRSVRFPATSRYSSSSFGSVLPALFSCLEACRPQIHVSFQVNSCCRSCPRHSIP